MDGHLVANNSPETNRIPQQAEIRRVSGLSSKEYEEVLSSGQTEPIIVSGEIAQWPADKKWSFDFFRESYGKIQVILSDNLASPTKFKKINLRQYLDYIEEPASQTFDTSGEGTKWYAAYWAPFCEHPELRNDFEQPQDLSNWFSHLQGPMCDWYHDGFAWLLLGPAGASTAAHLDLFGTHAWTGQLRGRKKFTLYPPTFHEGTLSVEHAVARGGQEVILSEGEILVIPFDWAHSAEALTPSMTLTYNFINQSNFGDFLQGIYLDPAKWEKKFSREVIRNRLGLKPRES
jgi:hypothetical protein